MNSSGGAKLTVQAALNAAAQVDFNGFTVTISVGSGTFTGDVNIPRMTGQSGISNLSISGAGSTTILSRDAGFSGSVRCVTPGAMGAIANLKIQNLNANGIGIQATTGGTVQIASGVEIGSTGYAAISTDTQGIVNSFNGGTVSANTQYLFQGSAQGIVYVLGGTWALGTRTFTTTALATTGAYIKGQGVTYTGTVTAKRYEASVNAIVDSAGGGANAFSGNVAGTTSAGGQYQ